MVNLEGGENVNAVDKMKICCGNIFWKVSAFLFYFLFFGACNNVDLITTE